MKGSKRRYGKAMRGGYADIGKAMRGGYAEKASRKTVRRKKGLIHVGWRKMLSPWGSNSGQSG